MTLKLPASFNDFTRYLRHFRKGTGGRFWTMLALSFASSLSEGLGLAMFLPLIRPVGIQTDRNDNLARIVRVSCRSLGMDASPRSILVLMLVFFAIKGLLKYLETYVRGLLLADHGDNIRKELLERYQKIGFSYFQRLSKGEIAALLTTECQQSVAAFRFFNEFCVCVASMSAFFCFALFSSPGTTLLGSVFGLGLAGRLRFISRRTNATSRETSVRSIEFNNSMLQAMNAFKYLKASAMFPSFIERVSKTSHAITKSQRSRAKLDALWSGLSQPLSIFALVSLILIDEAISGRSIQSSLITLALIYKTMNTLMFTQGAWQMFSSVRGSLDSILKHLRVFEAHAEAAPDGHPAEFNSRIEMRGVTIKHEGRKTLRGIDLDFDQGSFVALVGRSGSGKTTLLETLCGLHPMTAGTISIDGRVLDEAGLHSFRSRIGFVPQDPVIFNGTVLENICIGGETDEAMAWQCLSDAGGSEFVHALPVGILTPIGERGIPLSGGQKQRVALARELFKKPRVLLLDEPTSALDSVSEEHVISSLLRLKHKMAVIMISHRPAMLDRCDRMVVLDAGRVVEEGRFEELTSRIDSEFLDILNGQNSRANRPSTRVQPDRSIVACCKIMRSSGEIAVQIMDISLTGVGLQVPPGDAETDPIFTVGNIFDSNLVLEEITLPVRLEVVHASRGILGTRFVNITPKQQHLVEKFTAKCVQLGMSAAA